MSPTIAADVDELEAGRIVLEDEGPSVTDGDGGGDGGTSLPPSPPPPVDRRGYGGRPPRWQQLVLWAGMLLLSALAGALVGRSIGKLGLVIERGLARGES